MMISPAAWPEPLPDEAAGCGRRATARCPPTAKAVAKATDIIFFHIFFHPDTTPFIYMDLIYEAPHRCDALLSIDDISRRASPAAA
jgi:hypothetical protein